jgi:hypothetical protein
MNYLDQIMAYEDGTLSVDDTIQMFVDLLNDGIAYQLQGSYGRAAASMVNCGIIIIEKGEYKRNPDWESDDD